MRRRRLTIAVLAVAVAALATATALAWDRGGDEPPVTAAPPPRAAAGLDGRALFSAKGCEVCHLGPGETEGFSIGPDLRELRVAGSRVNGLSAAEYVRESILVPGAVVVAGYGPMPSLGVTAAEAERLVAYLLADPAR